MSKIKEEFKTDEEDDDDEDDIDCDTVDTLESLEGGSKEKIEVKPLPPKFRKPLNKDFFRGEYDWQADIEKTQKKKYIDTYIETKMPMTDMYTIEKCPNNA